MTAVWWSAKRAETGETTTTHRQRETHNTDERRWETQRGGWGRLPETARANSVNNTPNPKVGSYGRLASCTSFPFHSSVYRLVYIYVSTLNNGVLWVGGGEEGAVRAKTAPRPQQDCIG